MVFRPSVRYVSNSQRSEGSTAFAILRLASAMIAERCRSSAASNAFRAAFFSVGVQGTYFMNCSGVSIDIVILQPLAQALIGTQWIMIILENLAFNRSDMKTSPFL